MTLPSSRNKLEKKSEELPTRVKLVIFQMFVDALPLSYVGTRGDSGFFCDTKLSDDNTQSEK